VAAYPVSVFFNYKGQAGTAPARKSAGTRSFTLTVSRDYAFATFHGFISGMAFTQSLSNVTIPFATISGGTVPGDVTVSGSGLVAIGSFAWPAGFTDNAVTAANAKLRFDPLSMTPNYKVNALGGSILRTGATTPSGSVAVSLAYDNAGTVSFPVTQAWVDNFVVTGVANTDNLLVATYTANALIDFYGSAYSGSFAPADPFRTSSNDKTFDVVIWRDYNETEYKGFRNGAVMSGAGLALNGEGKWEFTADNTTDWTSGGTVQTKTITLATIEFAGHALVPCTATGTDVTTWTAVLQGTASLQITNDDSGTATVASAPTVTISNVSNVISIELGTDFDSLMTGIWNANDEATLSFTIRLTAGYEGDGGGKIEKTTYIDIPVEVTITKS